MPGISDSYDTFNTVVKQTIRPIFNVKDFGARGDNGTDDTVAIVAAIAAAKAVGGVAFFPPGRYICSNLTLPTDLNGYGIEGEFAPIQNDMASGSIIVAKAGSTGTLWSPPASHSNGIWIRRLGFDTNTQALTIMLDLSQAELASFFLLEDVWILGNANMGAASFLLNLDGNEGTVLRRVGLSPNGMTGGTLKAHVTGGELTFQDCVALSGTMKVGGLLVKWVNCVQGGPIICDSGSVNLFVFVNHWIESLNLGGDAIQNTSGQQLRIQITGARLNQRSSRAIIAAGSTSTIARVDGAICVSDDASATPLMSGGGARLFLGANVQFISGAIAGASPQGFQAIWGIDNRSGLTAVDGSPLTLFTLPAGAGQLFRVAIDIFATAFTSGTATYTLTWTENGGTRTLVVTATAINVIGTGTDLINPDASTAITVQLTGVFTATVKVAAVVEQLA